MKKASAIVIYNNETKQIYYLAIIYKNNLIPFIDYSNEKTGPYKYENFNGMYKTVLNVAKNNGYYIPYVNQFGRRFYNVYWVDKTKPKKFEKFGFDLEEKQ